MPDFTVRHPEHFEGKENLYDRLQTLYDDYRESQEIAGRGARNLLALHSLLALVSLVASIALIIVAIVYAVTDTRASEVWIYVLLAILLVLSLWTNYVRVEQKATAKEHADFTFLLETLYVEGVSKIEQPYQLEKEINTLVQKIFDSPTALSDLRDLYSEVAYPNLDDLGGNK